MHDDRSDGAVPLESGPRISIRPVRAGDASELRRLYDALDTDDRHRRFFSSYHPGPRFFADLTTVERPRGARFVAVLHAPPSEDRVVGEAGYGVLPDGNGELAMTIERGSRGWLGPYLLDAVAESAAASGVPNLEADVLTVDGPMLGLLRSRGSVVMEHDGWSVVRLLIGTGGRRPTWPASGDRLRACSSREPVADGTQSTKLAPRACRCSRVLVRLTRRMTALRWPVSRARSPPKPMSSSSRARPTMVGSSSCAPTPSFTRASPCASSGRTARQVTTLSTTCPIVACCGVLSFVADLCRVPTENVGDVDDQRSP